jgi:hypothetical protein
LTRPLANTGVQFTDVVPEAWLLANLAGLVFGSFLRDAFDIHLRLPMAACFCSSLFASVLGSKDRQGSIATKPNQAAGLKTNKNVVAKDSRMGTITAGKYS